MKKLLALMLSFIVLLSFSACGNGSADNISSDSSVQSNTDTSSSTENTSNSKTLVIYFSCTGNTKSAASKIAELAGADIYELNAKEPYTSDDINYSNDNCRANVEMNDSNARPALGGEKIDLSSYDNIIIGYPIWWGTMPRIINTLFDSYDFTGKVILPFCTSGGSSVNRSVSDIRSYVQGANVRDGLRANGASDSEIKDWLSKNGIIQ